MTRVSVCVPTYNGAQFIAEAVQSILSQAYPDFELIVSDDCSSDDTRAILATIQDSRVRVVENERRLGLVGNWNRCLGLASGEYVTIFHQDDLMRPDNLIDKAATLDAHPNVGLVYSNIETIDADGTISGGHWLPQPRFDAIEPGQACFERLALTGNFIACPTVVLRVSCYQELGGFDTRLPFTCDLEMWMRIAGRYDVGYLAAPLVANRVHAGQETRRFSGAGREIREVRRALDIALAEHAPAGISHGLKRSACRNLASWSYRMGRWKLGERHWRAALGYFSAGGEALLGALI